MPHKDPDARRAYARDAAKRRRDAAALARSAEIQAWVDERPRLPETDLAYAAGMFEGEGTITIIESRNHLGNMTARCVVSLTNTDWQIIEFYNSRWPGAVQTRKREQLHHRQGWAWRIQGNPVLRFIADVRPHLRTDAEIAKFEIVERVQRMRRQGLRDPAVRAEVADLMGQIRHLNHRGVDPAWPAAKYGQPQPSWPNGE